VQLGDWADFPSLSSYDAGKLSSHGQFYREDVKAVNASVALFERELKKYSPRGWRPRKVITLGNHCDRVRRAVEDAPKLYGELTLDDLDFKRAGWEVHPFLKIVNIHNIRYSHFFCVNANGRVTNTRNGQPSAAQQVKRMMCSATAGHRQSLDVAIYSSPEATYRGIIAGSCYLHDENYLSPQGQRVWHGILVKNDVDVKTGEYDLMEVSLRYLSRRYG
jgi:hypothetical protein